MPLAPTSYIRLDYKADRAEALYADAQQTIEAAINAPEEQQQPQCSGSSGDGRARPAAPIDIPLAALEPASMDLGSGSYREAASGYSGTPRSGRTPRGTPRTPRTSAKAHHQHTNSGGSLGSLGGGSKPKGLGRNSSRKRN
jgi:hypothetical protein